MPRTFTPRPALKVSSIHSLYCRSPRWKVGCPSISKVAPRRSPSTVSVKGSVMFGLPATMLLAGPMMRERITSPSRWRRRTVCSPPVCAACPSVLFVLKKPKVPWLPRRSGTHMPESSSPLNFTGGKVIGTRWMVEVMFLLPSSFQKAWLFCSSRMRGLSSGTMYLPMFSTFLALVISVDESIGA